MRVSYGAVARDVQAAFPAAQLARLRHGLSLDGRALKPAGVDWQNPEQLRFVLNEGRKRQIRRMCELVGLKVVGLEAGAHRPGRAGPAAAGAVALPRASTSGSEHCAFACVRFGNPRGSARHSA